jgi:hypothetical protein
MTDAPLVGIGMPTHNGERYIAEALGSLLAQDYGNVEIVVADNASSDRTPEIVREFMRRDSRIRHERSEAFLSAGQNFNRAFALTTGDDFMWAADDDRWDPTYVRRCTEALMADPTAVMASTGLRFIDPDGAVIERDYRLYDNPDLSSPSVVERVRILLRRGGFYQVYGLARREALGRTHMIQDIHGSDVVLTLELAMLGPIRRVPEPLFFFRRYPDRDEKVRVERQGGIADAADALSTPMTHLQELLSDAVRRSALPAATKVRLRGEILRAAYVDETPMRSRTRHEVGPRVRAAWRRRDPRRLVKYAVAWSVDQVPKRPWISRRWVARSKRIAAGVRRRLPWGA